MDIIEARKKMEEAKKKKDKEKKKVYIFGYTKGAWGSLVIKSIRLGWLPGLENGIKALGDKEVKRLMWRQIWEDVFPREEELPQIRAEIDCLDFRAYLKRDTHHGQGLSDAFCDMQDMACQMGNDYPETAKMGRTMKEDYGLTAEHISRVWNCVFTWLCLKQNCITQNRTIDETPWTGIPKWAFDRHTSEGWQMNTLETPLSGTYEMHREIGKNVQAKGWESFRKEVWIKYGSAKVEFPPEPQENEEERIFGQLKLI